MDEILQELEDDEKDISRLYIEPPEPNVESDEDSADEDEGGMLDNLTGRQLRAGAEVLFANNARTQLDPELSTDDAEEGDNCKPSKKNEKRKRNQRKQRKWGKHDLCNSLSHFPECDFSKYRDFSPYELLELFFDEDIFNMILAEIPIYAQFKNEPDPAVTKAELKVFIAVLILSGYNRLPGKRFYWDSGTDMRNEMVHAAIRRDRFIQIMKFLHFADNNAMDSRDKLWKLRPLIKKLQNKFVKHFVPVPRLSYDESMIAYYGPHGCKQYIKGKPIRFGYKVWSLNTPSGYLVNFDVYQGKNVQINEDYEKQFGKAATPLIQMIDSFDDDTKNLPFSLYFDNLFTGMELLSYLKQEGYNGTGTIRESRVPKECTIMPCKDMKKLERGTFTYKCSDDGILVARWQDTGSVTVATTVHSVNPVGHVRRYSKKEKKYIMIPRPLLIGEYNKYMGGTDLMDENVNRHRISIRGKKWWWSIFTWLLDVSVQNAWQLHRSVGSKLTQLEFKREIVRFYLTSYGSSPRGAGRPSTSKASVSKGRLPDSIRYDGKNHYIIQNLGNKRRRCAGEYCKSVGRTACSKCDVGLCVSCFLTYHTGK